MKRLCSVLLLIVMIISVGVMPRENATADTQREQMTQEKNNIEKREDDALYKYNTLLKCWAYDGVVSDTNAAFPAFYGGAYIDEEKNLVIQVTSLDEGIKKYFSDLIDINNVRFENVKYSYSELLEEHSRIKKVLYKEKKNNLEKLVVGVGLKLVANSVRVYLDCDNNMLENKDFVRKMEEILDVSDSIIFEAEEKITPVDALYPGDGIHYRSVGFWAVDNNGDYGIVTAPHHTIYSGSSVYVGGTCFGNAATAYPEGNCDAVFVKCNNSNFLPTRYVPTAGFYLSSTDTIYVCERTMVYKRGNTTGYTYGMVDDVCCATTKVNDAVRAFLYVKGGDSGGIVAAGGNSYYRYANGLIFGSTSNTVCYYSKVQNVLSTLGVSLY